ncbi:NEL-type E3 ubiquitin ligase domain-containing protein [Pseudomonas wadenswilerensis]|uniref:NEL-type E3 ubiquitin ligase domain-containing protein n=1 Tax=Pseudomonas wadenswilerensis TaxID=1785161 RepID=UPI003208A87B
MTTPPPVSVPGLHGPFILQRLPAWIRHARPENFDQMGAHLLPEQHGRDQGDWFASASEVEKKLLADYQVRSRRSGQRLARELKDFKGIGAFCEPLLKARLKADLGVEPDIDNDEFVRIERESVLLGSMLKTVPRRQRLMQAALQNFAADSEFEDGTALAPKDAFFLERVPGSEQGYPRFRYRYSQKLDIEPQAFARLCHDLDLGGQYQRHLGEVFEHPRSSTRRRSLAIELYKDLLRVRLQVAFLKQQISEQARAVLLELVQGGRAPRWGGKPVRCSQLSMFGVPLSEVLVIGPERDDNGVEPVLLYLPGAPDAPLKEYPSVRAARDDLKVRLRQPAYQALLRSYVPHSSQEHVLSRLQDTLYHLVNDGDGLYWRRPNPGANLHVRETFIDQELFGYLQDRHVQKIKDDARALAVPSADVDDQAWRARLAYWESIGFNLLNAAAFFVPSLGAVMAAVAAAQLIGEVVEGAHAWEAGDLDEAWAHLKSVGLNIAIVAGLGVAGRALEPVAASETINGLVKVRLPDGQQRLWQPALGDYAREVNLQGIEPDANGHYLADGKRYIRLGSDTFEVAQAGDGQWQVLHPSDPTAYRPLLDHNSDGAWLAHGEQPLAWSRLQLLRRSGHATEGLTDTELLQAGEISGIDDNTLRAVHAGQRALPPLLADTLQRLRLDRQLDTWIGKLRSGSPGGIGRGFSAVLATELPGWLNLPIEVFRGAGLSGDSAIYGLDRWPDTETFKVLMSELHDNRLPEVILQRLDEPAIKRLVGVHVPRSERLQVLRDALATRAEQRRVAIFDSIYATPGEQASAEVRLLQRSFPALALQAAEELVGHATPAELEQMRQVLARVPLRLAEEARLYQRQVRLNRAMEGMFEPRLASLDSDRLMVGLLEHLPGWSGQVRLQVHEGSADGQLLMVAGEPDATLKTLLRKDGRYSAYDAEGNELTVNDDMAGALLKALPDSERQVLGLQLYQPMRLRTQLTALASSDRLRASKLIGQQPVRPWLRTPMRLADGRIGYPLSGRGAADRRFDSGLLIQLRSLYPILEPEQAERFLEELGLTDADRLAALERRRSEYRQLTDALNQWVERGQYTDAGDDRIQVVHERVLRQVAEKIKKAWRRETARAHAGDGRFIGYQLDLSNLRLGALPTLTADFSHVADVRLSGMNLQSVPSGFLQVFTRLRWLNLSNNRLTMLADALAELQGLTKLELQRNRLVMDQVNSTVLARLTSLKLLNLNENPLGQPPAVGTLAQLLNLCLMHTGISTWPAGVFELERLELLDLRDNQITSIAQTVLEPVEHVQRVERVNRATVLHGNPLDADSLTRLEVYRRRTEWSMGISPALRGPHVAPLPTPSQGVDLWLEGTDADRAAQVRAHWQALSEQPESGEFFRLLNDLRSSTDFTQAYRALCERVWRMLKAASDSTRLREELFEFVAHPNTCADGVILVFSQLEVLVLVQEAYEAGTAVGTEYALIDLARGLSRLDAVERIALRDIAARRAAGLRVDDVEVRLAYRIGLARRLELPGQPEGMRFAHMANVTEGQLDGAETEVLAAETAQALRETIASRDFWITFLKSRYGERFDEVNKPFFARLEALEADKGSMRDQVYRTRVETIQQRRGADEQRLIETLTTQIWNSIPDQVTRL